MLPLCHCRTLHQVLFDIRFHKMNYNNRPLNTGSRTVAASALSLAPSTALRKVLFLQSDIKDNLSTNSDE